MKKDNGKARVIYHFIMLAIMAFSVTVAVVAWMYNTKKGELNETRIIATEATGFKISTDGSIYGNSSVLPIPESVTMQPISGNGTKFYVPKLPAGSNDPSEAIGWEEITYDENADVNYYYKQTLYFRAIAPGYIILDEISLTPSSSGDCLENTDKSALTRPIENSLGTKYIFDDNVYLSKDYIATAARVYLHTQEETNDLMYLPLDNYIITLTDDSATTKLISLDKEGTPVGNENCTFYDGSGFDYYSSLPNINFYRDSESNDSVKLTELKSNNKVGIEELYECTVDVYIWIDGFDSEAISCLSGGQFNLHMKFSFERKDS